MSHVDDIGLPSQHPGPDDAPELLTRAHSRLPLVPARFDGSKVVVVATFGAFDLRLVELNQTADGIPPLWIELYDTHARRIIDGVGRQALVDLAAPAGRLIARARRLGGIAPSDGSP